ncbi:hypothetical protein [Roseomonas xinghualingensis]|uniref:hypothetical protein n=1 Tax=Roseomonas xinghualingensis TaxID=2986475 RepID=UPI0021F24305|nr:hypothetical protein [Roseomonas sp. SXEYE001]MCV4207251.1 hypothetical protein [Roseomonas sp. SXEYE001]
MFDPTTYTGFHTWLSLIAMAAGFVAVAGLLAGRERHGWTVLFLVTAIGTSATGFGFPFQGVLPSHVVGVLALLVLAVALLARYGRHLSGGWRAAYVVTMVISLYLLTFVGVAQIFQKIPAFADTAPVGFALAQLALLVGFALLTMRAVKRFRLPDAPVPSLGQPA